MDTQTYLIDPTQNLNVNWTYVSSNDFYNEFGYDLNTRTKQKIQSSASYSKVWSQFNNRLSISISESYDLNADKLYPNENEPIIYYKSSAAKSQFSHTNSKIFGNGDKWYNSIYYSYSSKFSGIQNIGHVDENTDISEIQLLSCHNINISAPNKLFKWLTINPSINLKEGWVFKYNIDNNPDNLKDGFKRRLTGSFSVSTSTTLYGLFPINIFNANSLRHVMYPTLSLTYSPNYNDTFFGYDFGYFSNVDGISTDYFRNTMIGSTQNMKINASI